jgi:transcriptional regulator with XRE-family HTH domain
MAPAHVTCTWLGWPGAAARNTLVHVSRDDPTPPSIPEQFWERAEVRDVLARRSPDGSRDIGGLLRLINRRTGTSQTKIGAAVGLEQGYISKIINGQRTVVSIDVLERLANGLGMTDAARMLLGLAPPPTAWQASTDAAKTMGRLELARPLANSPTSGPDLMLSSPHGTLRKTLMCGAENSSVPESLPSA